MKEGKKESEYSTWRIEEKRKREEKKGGRIVKERKEGRCIKGGGKVGDGQKENRKEGNTFDASDQVLFCF